MFEKNIDGAIIATLEQRIKAINREGSYAPLEPQNSTINDSFMTDVMNRSVWAKVTSTVMSKGGDEVRLKNISTMWENGQEKRVSNRPLSSQVSLFTSDPEATFRPQPGITSINTQYKNSYMQYVTINFTIWDKSQFEEYENAFMKHGRIIMAEWGWSNSSVGGINATDGGSFNSLMKSQQQQILNKGGDYCVATGKVKSFSWNIGPNGEYKCTTDLISMANDVFGGQIDSQDNKVTPDYTKSNVQDAMAKANLRFKNFMDKLDQVIEVEGGGYYSTKLKKGWCTWSWFESRLNSFFALEDGGKLISKIDSSGSPALKNPTLYTTSWDCMTGKVDKISDIKSAIELDYGGETDQFRGFYASTKEEYKTLAETLGALEGLVNAGNGTVGGFVFSAKFLQDHFGKGVNDIENALNSFWATVSGYYGGLFNFKVVHDVTEPAVPRIGVKEENTTTLPVKSSALKLSIYGKNSLVRDFSLNVKMDSKMVTQAMYHSGKGPSTAGDQALNAPEDIAIKALASLQSQFVYQGPEPPAPDEVLKDLTFPYLRGNIVRGASSEPMGDKLQKVLSADVAGSQKALEANFNEIERLAKNEKQIADMEGEGFAYPTGKEGGPYLIWDLKGQVIPGFKNAMMAQMTDDNSSAGGIAPIVPISISFTLTGIGGIRPFDIFDVDYLPKKYAQFCDFRVRSVSHDVSPQGWNTKIDANMRVDWNKVKQNQAANTPSTSNKSSITAADYAALAVQIALAKKEIKK